MTHYPLNFSGSATATQGLASPWLAKTADEHELECSIPREFGGPHSGFSPEDLYIQAILNCYIATLKVVAENSKLTFQSIKASADLTLDRDDAASAPWMKSANLKFQVTGVEEVERFRRMMERVSSQCMVLNSVKTALSFEFEIAG